MLTRPGLTRRWQDLRRLPGRVPLRVRLISALLALVAVALAAISVAGISFLRDYLIGEVDTTLQALPSQPHTRQYVQDCVLPTAACTASSAALVWLPPGGSPEPIVVPVRDRFGLRGQPQRLPGPAVGPALGWLLAHHGQPRTLPAQSGGGRWRVISFPETVLTAEGPVTGTVIAGIDVSSPYNTLGKLVSIDLIVSGVVVVSLALVGVGIVRSSLRPLTDIEHTAAAIAAGDLSRRVPDLEPHTEVGRLARALNMMLSQIEAAFHARSASEADARSSQERLRRFVADASHELRTPLTAIRGYAEYYRQLGGLGGGHPDDRADGSADRSLTTAELDRIMQRVEQESTRMGTLVEDMLLLARLDQQRPLELRPVDLLALAADAVQDARMIAPARDISLTVGAGPAFLVLGDEPRLRQVIGNLMGNALAHTPPATPVQVRVRASGAAKGSAGVSAGSGPATVTLEVADQGPGLTAEQAERVFERFYRADQARARRTGGTGLGLAIVAALVAAHGGTVAVNSSPGQGSTFAITLPLAP